MSGTATLTEGAVLVVEAAEQRVLADRLVALDVDVPVDGGLVDRDQGPARPWPSESNPPALTSDSITRLLQTAGGTLPRKSAKSA